MAEEHKNKEAKERYVKRIFYENPYDIEVFFEALNIASTHNKELQFVDRFITHMRLDPMQDITTIVFNILRDFEIIKYE